MLVNNQEYRTVWMEENKVLMIDQNLLPFQFRIITSRNHRETCEAIKNMSIRGAGAIGAAAGYAMAQAFLEKKSRDPNYLQTARKRIESTRPTARNLFYATEKVFTAASISKNPGLRAKEIAQQLADEDASSSRMIGKLGSKLIKKSMRILTHCNAGWLAFVDYGTALSPIYFAHSQAKNPFVYVDATGPRRQGARLTAWELNQAGIKHLIIPDNAGAFLMADNKIDLIITGADRIAANGDTANKIGTLEKAITAQYYGIPFYIAAPCSTIDSNCPTGEDIKIEFRSPDEELYRDGQTSEGSIARILVSSPGSKAVNPAFDVTPSNLITGIITEKGIIKACSEEITRILV